MDQGFVDFCGKVNPDFGNVLIAFWFTLGLRARQITLPTYGGSPPPKK
jgi:hypothetical protein